MVCVLGGIYLDIEKSIILIVSDSLKVGEMLNQIFDINEAMEVITLDINSLLKDGNRINPSLIILDEDNIESHRCKLKYINESRKLSQADIMMVLKQEQTGFLKEFIDNGVRECIIYPFTSEELYLRVENIFQYGHIRRNSSKNVAMLKSLMNNIPFMTWFKDTESKYLNVNKKFEEFAGISEIAIIGKGDQYIWNGKISTKCEENDRRVIEEGKQIVFDEAIPGVEGERQFRIYKSPIIDEYENISGTIGIARDITEIINKEAEMDIILDNIPFGVCLKDENGIILNVNSKLLGYYGIKKEDIIGKDGSSVLNRESYELLKEEDNEIIRSKTGRIFERKLNINGEDRIMEVHKEPIIDIFNSIIGIVVLIRDVTDTKNYQDNIRKLAYIDPLTGLDNRRSLYEYISEELETKNTDLTILLIDLDNFKELNDNLGHYYGDEALVEISKRIKEVCREAFVARSGGDEFIIIKEKIWDREVLTEKINQLLQVVNGDLIHGEGKTNQISASIGVVEGNSQKNKIENLLTKGNLALYKAKENGKNQFVLYTEDLEIERTFNLEIERDLKNCIKNQEVMVYYQPQYGKDNTTGGAVLIGFEALFRWNNNKYKHMPVIDIIRTIEKCNIMNIIDEYVIVESFKFAKKINEGRNEKLVVSINISALQIMEDNFLEHFIELINQVEVSPEIIGVEITETVLIENIDKNINKIIALKNMGIKVALDDFGTGYSSLSYLVKLPLSHVKIDKSFIRNMKNGNEYIKLIGLIIEAAHSLRLKVVAEGVEKYEELAILDEMGIDFIQGYLFSRPLPQEAAEKLALQQQ